MNDITIVSNHHWHRLRYRYDVPAEVLADQFAHLTEDDGNDDGYFQYRGWWYHMSDFTGTTGELHRKGWSGYHGDSYFSGVVIMLDKHGERYCAGTYYS